MDIVEKRRLQGCCLDCGRKYGDQYGFPDLVVSPSDWEIISPTGDEGGLLCPSCMCRRAFDAGLTGVMATFTSGPFCVDQSAEITRLRARLAEAEAAKADAWDEAMKAARNAARLAMVNDPSIDEYSCSGCAAAIRALVNPYRSKTDEPQ